MFGLICIHSGTGRKPRIPVLLLYLASALQAQNTPATTVHGEISQESGELPRDLSVELLLQGRPIEKVCVTPNGTFEFRGVAVGQYELRVTNLQGDIIRRDYISVNSYSSPKVVTTYPRARLPLARTLACRGEIDEAAKQLRSYLGSPQAENRQRIESWLAELLGVEAR